ncbi:MAG: heavy metal translocating P-type ATPase, partial [Promethearchaeota archaeon]
GILIQNFIKNPRYIPLYYILFGISYILASYSVYLEFFEHLKKFNVFEENFLMIIATIGAIFTSNFIEAIAVMLFYELGEIFEDYGVFKSENSIQSLLSNQPEIAHLRTTDEKESLSSKYIDIHPNKVAIGSRLIIKPGERIPLDGILISLNAICDTSALTGESIPREIMKGEVVYSGMVNQNCLIEIEVIREYKNSAMMRIFDLVTHAEKYKSKAEKFISKFAKRYTPTVVIIAVFLAVLPPLIIQDASFSNWLYRAMIFLVISCPCALVISVPLTYFSGIGRASRSGILIKGTQYLESLAKIDAIVFDKTGTITHGKFEVNEIHTDLGTTSEELLELASCVENYSTHPIANSIRRNYEEKQKRNIKEKNSARYKKNQIQNLQEYPGRGIGAIVNGKNVVVGNDQLLHDLKIPHNPEICCIPGTVVHVSHDFQYLGHLHISDAIKPEVIQALSQLHKLGIKDLYMLSGDKKSIVKSVANELGFDHYAAELFPEEKLNQFQKIRTQHELVGYVGDGINDTPVLAGADVSFAMGNFGSDAAIDVADIILVSDKISKIGEGIQIARKTHRINLENLVVIFLVKFLFLLLGALGFMTIWGAVFADVGIALLAIMNSQRLLIQKKLKNTMDTYISKVK